MLSSEDVVRKLLSDRTKLLAFIRTIVLNHHTAEDIHQDIVILSMNSAEMFQDDNHLFAWARRVAKTKAIDYLRQSGRRPKHFDPNILDALETQWQSNWQVEPSRMSIALGDCIGKLRPQARLMIGLRYTSKLSGDEISQRTGMSLASVYVTLSRIYRSLENCVQRKLASQE